MISMLDLVIAIVLLIGVTIGIKRGFIVQVLHLTSIIIALIVSYTYYKPLAEKIVLWIPYPSIMSKGNLAVAIDRLDLDRTFYQALAFIVLFFIVKIALQMVMSIVDVFTYVPILRSVNKLLGAILGGIESYFILLLVLNIAVLLPNDMIQSQISSSILASTILKHTPIVTDIFQRWWYVYAQK